MSTKDNAESRASKIQMESFLGIVNDFVMFAKADELSVVLNSINLVLICCMHVNVSNTQ